MNNILSGCVLNILFWLIILPLTILITTPFIMISALLLISFKEDEADEAQSFWQLVMQGYRKTCRVWLDMLGFC